MCITRDFSWLSKPCIHRDTRKACSTCVLSAPSYLALTRRSCTPQGKARVIHTPARKITESQFPALEPFSSSTKSVESPFPTLSYFASKSNSAMHSLVTESMSAMHSLVTESMSAMHSLVTESMSAMHSLMPGLFLTLSMNQHIQYHTAACKVIEMSAGNH